MSGARVAGGGCHSREPASEPTLNVLRLAPHGELREADQGPHLCLVGVLVGDPNVIAARFGSEMLDSRDYTCPQGLVVALPWSASYSETVTCRTSVVKAAIQGRSKRPAGSLVRSVM